MSTYQELKGLKVKYLSADTSGDRAKEGEIFYNSSGFTMASHIASAAWVSSSSMSTARANMGGAGDKSAHLVFGGPPAATTTEEYNGVGWSSGGALNTGSNLTSGTGTQTAGLKAGGWTGSANQNMFCSWILQIKMCSIPRFCKTKYVPGFCKLKDAPFLDSAS